MKRRIDLSLSLAGVLRMIGERVPREQGERVSYDRTIRWLIRTHPEFCDTPFSEHRQR